MRLLWRSLFLAVTAGCVSPEPLGLVEDGVTDVALLIFDENYQLEATNPFEAYDPEMGLNLRVADHGRWAVVGYGPVDGVRLTGLRPRPPSDFSQPLPPPRQVLSSPDFLLRRERPPPLAIGPQSCPDDIEPRTIGLSCGFGYGWTNPIPSGACTWATRLSQTSLDGRMPDLEGLFTFDGRTVPARLTGRGPCVSGPRWQCPTGDGDNCRVYFGYERGVETIDILQDRFPKRSNFPARCRSIGSLASRVGPVRSIEWSSTPWVAVLRGGPYSECQGRGCPPPGVLRAMSPEGEKLNEVEGFFETVFEIPERPELVGVVERTGNTEGCANAVRVSDLPEGDHRWELQARRRERLEVVARLRLDRPNSGARTASVISTFSSLGATLMMVEDRNTQDNQLERRLLRASLGENGWTLETRPSPRLRGLVYGFESFGGEIAMHSELHWTVCPAGWFEAPNAFTCRSFDASTGRIDLLSGVVIEDQQRLVSNNGNLTLQNGAMTGASLSLLGDGAQAGARAFLRLDSRWVAVILTTFPEGVLTSSLVLFDLRARRFASRRVRLGPGWVNRMDLIDGTLHLLDASEGEVYRIPRWPSLLF